MAVQRDVPYAGFNFLVDLGDGETEGPHAGFQQVSGLCAQVQVIEYRNGNAKQNSVIKIPGLHKSSDVTLKRGITGSLALWQWFDQVRSGDIKSRRTVTIRLQTEDHSAVVQAWRLSGAFPIKYCGPAFDAQGNDVAMEEVVISCERMDIE